MYRIHPIPTCTLCLIVYFYTNLFVCQYQLAIRLIVSSVDKFKVLFRARERVQWAGAYTSPPEVLCSACFPLTPHGPFSTARSDAEHRAKSGLCAPSQVN